MDVGMGTRWRDGGYSSDIEIYLCADGQRLRVAQVGPAQLILRDRCKILPGTPAVILIRVDGAEEEHPIILDRGCSA